MVFNNRAYVTKRNTCKARVLKEFCSETPYKSETRVPKYYAPHAFHVVCYLAIYAQRYSATINMTHDTLKTQNEEQISSADSRHFTRRARTFTCLPRKHNHRHPQSGTRSQMTFSLLSSQSSAHCTLSSNPPFLPSPLSSSPLAK